MYLKKTLFALAIVTVFGGRADAQTITGKWTAQYPSRVRAGGGGEAVETVGVAILSIDVVKGDSVFGTWHPQNTPVRSEPRRIVGTFSGGHLTLLGAPVEAKIRRGGSDADEQTITMQTTFEATVAADSIVGTMTSASSDGSITSSPLKWTAKRGEPAKPAEAKS
jgi:hypothetical protein